MRRVNILLVTIVLFFGYGCASLQPKPPTITKNSFQDNNYPCFIVNFDREYEYKKKINRTNKSGYVTSYLFKKYTNNLFVVKGESKKNILWTYKPLSRQVYNKRVIYNKENKNISGILDVNKVNDNYMLRIMIANRLSDNYFAGIVRYFPLLGSDSNMSLDEAVELVKDEKYSVANGIEDKKKLVDYYMKNINRIDCPDEEK